MKTGIYFITNLNNGKVYVGSSYDIRRRWKQHLWKLTNNKHSNPHLQSAWNKYGKTAFTFEVAELIPKEELLKIEQQYLDLAKRLSQLYYNISFNAQSFHSGLKHSNETKAKLSAKGIKQFNNPEFKAKMIAVNLGNKYSLGKIRSDTTKAKLSVAKLGNKHRLGKKHSEEAKAKIAATKLGKKLSEEHKKKLSIAGLGKKLSKESIAKRTATRARNRKLTTA